MSDYEEALALVERVVAAGHRLHATLFAGHSGVPVSWWCEINMGAKEERTVRIRDCATFHEAVFAVAKMAFPNGLPELGA